MARDVDPMRANLTSPLTEPPVPDGVAVRAVREQDVESVGELIHVAYAGTVDDDGGTRAEHVEEAVRTLGGGYGPLQREASLVAEHDGVIVGAALVTMWVDGHLLLAHALVAPALRGRGLGTLLLTRSANALLAAGATHWTLAVTRGNPARRLYERLGFAVDESLRSRPRSFPK